MSDDVFQLRARSLRQGHSRRSLFRRSLLRPGIAWFAFVLLALGVAEAQTTPLPQFRVQWVDGAPALSFGAGRLVNRDVRRALESGLKKRIVLTVQSFRVGSSQPIATRRQWCDITHDLWDNSYLVRQESRSDRLASVSEVVRRCLAPRNLRVGAAKNYRRQRGRELYFAVRAEFNPISSSRCRQLLGSNDSDDSIGPIVVNIVRRSICQAERSLEFRSPSARVP